MVLATALGWSNAAFDRRLDRARVLLRLRADAGTCHCCRCAVAASALRLALASDTVSIATMELVDNALHPARSRCACGRTDRRPVLVEPAGQPRDRIRADGAGQPRSDRARPGTRSHARAPLALDPATSRRARSPAGPDPALLRMQEVRELPHAVRETRRRPRVVRVAVDRDCRAREPERRRARCRLLDAEAARPDDHELRLECEPRLPGRRRATAGRLGRGHRRRRRARSSRAASARRRTAARATRRRRRVASRQSAHRRRDLLDRRPASLRHLVAARATPSRVAEEPEPSRRPRPASAGRATAPRRRPGRPTRAHRSRPRRPRTDPG